MGTRSRDKKLRTEYTGKRKTTKCLDRYESAEIFREKIMDKSHSIAESFIDLWIN